MVPNIGCALWAALEEAKNLEEGKRLVMILPDSIRNYMTKYLSDDWMYLNGFLEEKTVLENNTPKLVPNRAWGQDFTVGDLPLTKSETISSTSTISDAIKAIGSHTQILVTDENEKVLGLFTTTVAMDRLSKGKIVPSDNVMKSATAIYRKTSKDIPLSELARIFTLTPFVVVEDQYVVTHQDLLNFFVEKS